MSVQPYHHLIAQLIGDDPEQSRTARLLLLNLDEDAVNPLIDTFYSGVSELGGQVILELIGQIGGPDALSLLRNIFHVDARHESWRHASALGLLYNVDNLDAAEADEVLAYIQT